VTVGAALALLPIDPAGPTSSGVARLPYVPRYPHEAHGYVLALTRLAHNEPARAWLAAADGALFEPKPVTLPLAAAGELVPWSSAVGYSFALPPGRRMTVRVERTRSESGELFVDLFRAVGSRYERVAGSLPRGDLQPFSIDAIEGGDYVLRVQPALGATAAYAVDVSAVPLLAFPVEGVDQRAIWSGFGAERDGGRRAHRGVDIFAARGTPALAATDGWVTRVETTRVGGNVVWMQPLFGNMRVYYAHLDAQWVEPGEFVLAGQVLGAVGNTGNAVTTPPHLHFGVYVRQPGVRGGARDPKDFLH
jgi:murein DD-endopeptidase MepM/ murein hydrolase activator NlpD